MAGIRIQNIPSGVTDKQLKVYFSNPKHGGGRIAELLYPMPNSTAVIVYEEEKDAQQILMKKHRVGDEKLVLGKLPRRVYNIVKVALDKRVSQFINRKPDIVDELQFVGELSVDFAYQEETYMMTGSWYKLEWAMQYLDNMLDVYEFDIEAEADAQNQPDSDKKAKNQDIKHSNIPPMAKDEPDHKQPSAGVRVNKNSTDNLEAIVSSRTSSRQSEKKYKNIQPPQPDDSRADGERAAAQPSMSMKSNILPRNIPSKTMKNNLSMEQGGKAMAREKPSATGKKNVGDWLNDNMSFMADNGLKGPDHPRRGFDPTFGFDGAGMFDRQMFGLPRVTKGIDVAATDFGDAPLTYVFDAANGMKVCVAKDDITQQDTDCIVNATSTDLANQYGVSRAIVKAVGPKLQSDCQTYVHSKGKLNTTQVIHTAAGGHLNPNVKFILHTAGPSWKERRSDEVTHSLVCTYINCLQYANLKLQLRSMAMPLISAGTFGFPLDVCVQAFYDAILLVTSSQTQARNMKEVNLICFDEESTMAVIMIIQSLQDCNIAQATQAAIERYKSNVAQNGVGADNFILTSDNGNYKTAAGRPVQEQEKDNKNAAGRPVQEQEKDSERERKQENEEKDEAPKNVKLDDKSDTESEEDEVTADDVQDRAVPVKSMLGAARSGYGMESRYGPAGKPEAALETKFAWEDSKEFDDGENDDEEVAEEQQEEKEEEETVEEEPKSLEKDRDTVPSMRYSFHRGGREQVQTEAGIQETDTRTAEQVTDDTESEDDADDDQVERDVSGAGNFGTSSDDEEEEDHVDNRDQADDQLQDIDEQKIDETVSKMSYLLEKVQDSPQDTEGNSRQNGDVKEEVTVPDFLKDKEDLSMCDSVGGSMVRIEKKDVDDFID